MLHNDISNRCYVKYSTITTEYSDTYSANLAKILSDTLKNYNVFKKQYKLTGFLCSKHYGKKCKTDFVL